MSESKRLRVGVIGCGGIAQMMHLPYLFSLPDRFELAALCDVSAQVMAAMGARYQVPSNRQFTRFQDLVAQDLDAVLVLTGGNHHPQTLAALEAGKHVFVEKPLCFTLREADESIAAAKRANRVLMVGNMKRYDPGYQYAQTQVQQMQDIRYVQINVLHAAETDYLAIHGIVRAADVPPKVLDELRAADDASAVQAVGEVAPHLREVYCNVLLGSIVHDVNALRGLLGEPEAVLSTELWFANHSDVCLTTTLKQSDAARVVLTWAYLPELRDYFQELAVMGAAGRVRIQFPSPYLRHFPTPIVVQGMENGAAYTKQVIASYAEAFQQELIALYACIVDGVAPLTDGASARKDIELLQKIFARLHPQGLGGEAAAYA